MDKINIDRQKIVTLNDLHSKCPDSDDAKAIFNYMVAGNKVKGATPNVYFFIDTVIYLVLDEFLFKNHGVFDISDLPLSKKLWFYISVGFIGSFKKAFQKDTDVFELMLTGAFKIMPPLEGGNPYKFRLITTDASYIGGMKIDSNVCFYILRSSLEEDECTGALYPLGSYLYRGADGVKHSSVFFESEVNSFIEFYHGGYDENRFIMTKTDTFFVEGKKVVKEKEHPSQGALPSLDYDKVPEQTYQVMVAVLFEVLKNEGRPKLKDQEAIYRHLEKFYPDVKGLNASYFRKFIKEGKDNLKKREEKEELQNTYEERFAKQLNEPMNKQ